MGNDGKQTYNTKYYNLDMIISIGFRVNSKKAIKFRTWANKIIKDYMVQGFALNDERFMKARRSDQEYFKRLLEQVKQQLKLYIIELMPEKIIWGLLLGKFSRW